MAPQSGHAVRLDRPASSTPKGIAMNARTIVAVAFLLQIAATSSALGALATDCTLYAAANGNDWYSGNSPAWPKTLDGTSQASQPGAVICLKAGTYDLPSTFYPARSGAPNAWIVYKAYGDGVVNLMWTGGAQDMFHFYGASLWNGRNYIEVRGLTFDGRNTAKAALKCNSSHHLRFVGNTIHNMGEAGILTKNCDYVTADSNMISHSGYRQGWSSGISFNSHLWNDAAPGFHSFVVNNIVSGSYDASAHHTDGNGIIMDLSSDSYDYSTADTPPALIANNVVFNNGGRCINVFVVTNIWTVNNTCYQNTLDLSQIGIGEITANNSRDCVFINNIAYAWNNRYAYQHLGTTDNVVYYKNLYFGGTYNFRYSDPSQFIMADPLFTEPPSVAPTSDGQYARALLADIIGARLTIRSDSPAIDKGIDPTTVPGASPEIMAGLRRYVFADITGIPRPLGNGFDIGAYEYAGPP
jgi:hypothetical protein